ncbi:MAG TPA: DMT family transporter [Cytophagales bacterium]|nr:DMT family transporter [Cytophagales bacterium]
MENYTQSKSQLNVWAVAITFLGVFLFAAKAILIKLSYAMGMDASTMIMLRMCSALPFYVIILFWGSHRQIFFSLTAKDHITIIALGAVGYYLSSFLDFLGLQYITANLERLILFAYPTMVVILSALFLKKKISRDQLIAIIVTYLGLVITLFDKLSLGANNNVYLGVVLILGSAFTYAIYLVGSGTLLQRIGTMVFTSYSMVVSALCVILHSCLVPTKPLAEIPQIVYVYGVIIAVFSTIIPSFLISYAIRQIGASKVSIIGSIGPVFTIFLSYYMLHETLSLYQIIGGVVILAGVLWVSRKK